MCNYRCAFFVFFSHLFYSHETNCYQWQAIPDRKENSYQMWYHKVMNNHIADINIMLCNLQKEKRECRELCLIIWTLHKRILFITNVNCKYHIQVSAVKHLKIYTFFPDTSKGWGATSFKFRILYTREIYGKKMNDFVNIYELTFQYSKWFLLIQENDVDKKPTLTPVSFTWYL